MSYLYDYPTRCFRESLKQGKYVTGNTVRWYLNGKLHRSSGPAAISHKTNNEEWWLYGDRHRDDGPAVIKKDSSGKIVAEHWYHQGNRHREDGPAVIMVDSKTTTEKWYSNDLVHRADGPAIIIKDNKGRVIEQHWYLGGYQLSEEEFLLKQCGSALDLLHEVMDFIESYDIYEQLPENVRKLHSYRKKKKEVDRLTPTLDALATISDDSLIEVFGSTAPKKRAELKKKIDALK